ncbi:MAG: ParB/RepB/Spo0J family partition protein [Bacteroidetes bacterium]|jgi:ParB family chromosome partitioning protein|nr:ParB/RepB/Spo0J family partition protein [Bacteroidota bacterium]
MAKAIKKQALGRGLSALLNESKSDITSVNDKNADKVVGNILEIELDFIEVNPYQPRSYFNEEALRELATSIQELGVIQPITVRKLEGNKFQLVSGERRFRASKLIGNTTIPAYIRIANDQEMLEMALVENIQRKDLDPIEVALSYQRLIDEIDLTQDQMSKRVGKKRSTISNYLRLLKLDPIVQTGMRDGFLSMGHGRAIINIENAEDQLSIYEQIIAQKLSVRQTEELVKSIKDGATSNKKQQVKKVEIPQFVTKGANTFSEYFGHKIDIKLSGNDKGKIIIPFHSEEDFNRLKKLLE